MAEVTQMVGLLVGGVFGYALAKRRTIYRLFRSKKHVFTCEVIEKIDKHDYRMLVSGCLKLRGSVTVWYYEDTGEMASGEVEAACCRTWQLAEFQANPGTKP